MKTLKEDFFEILKKDRGLVGLMLINFLFALGLTIYAFIVMDPSKSIVKVGYGDIGGYRDGVWSNMFVFPILGVLFGFLHSALAVKIYKNYNKGLAAVFLVITAALIFGALVVLIRLSKGI